MCRLSAKQGPRPYAQVPAPGTPQYGPQPHGPQGTVSNPPEQHCLEQRAAAPLFWPCGVLVALTGIHWREAWKYGIRAFRYCRHDCGQALAAFSYAAAALGWPVQLLTTRGDAQIAALTGVDREADFLAAEREVPEALLWIGPGEPPPVQTVLDPLAGATWSGRANTLSPAHRDWPDITRVATATLGPDDEPRPAWPPQSLPPREPVSGEPASGLIRRRRSAQAFDGATGLTAPAFFRLLDALLPRVGQPPWSLLATPPQVHPVLFVHRVEGLAAGIYALVRDPTELPVLQAELRPDWLWAPVPGCPDHLPLYLLAPLDLCDFAKQVSCHLGTALVDRRLVSEPANRNLRDWA